MTKPWYKSKTKLGSVFVGGSLVLSAVGGYLLGQMEGWTALRQAAVGAGMVLVGTGLRDALEGILPK